jgi:hypothetical protein
MACALCSGHVCRDCIYDEGHAQLVPHVIDAFLSRTDPAAVCHVVIPLAKYRAGVADFARIIDESM